MPRNFHRHFFRFAAFSGLPIILVHLLVGTGASPASAEDELDALVDCMGGRSGEPPRPAPERAMSVAGENPPASGLGLVREQRPEASDEAYPGLLAAVRSSLRLGACVKPGDALRASGNVGPQVAPLDEVEECRL